MKKLKIKQNFKAEHNSPVNSTLITHLFNFRSKEKGNGIHEMSINLQLHEEKHHQNTEPQGSQQVLQNPGLSKKCKNRMYNDVPSNPKCPTLKMT